MAEAELDVAPLCALLHQVCPPLEALRAAADLLATARNPALLVGSRITEADAVGELVALANPLGVPVFSEPVHTHGRLAFPADHPLYAQTIGLWAPDIAGRLAEFDVLLVAGMDLLREYVYHGPTPAIPPHLRLIHLDENAYQIGKNYPVEVGLLGAVKVGLAELDSLLAGQMSADQRDAAAARGEQCAERHRGIERASLSVSPANGPRDP